MFFWLRAAEALGAAQCLWVGIRLLVRFAPSSVVARPICRAQKRSCVWRRRPPRLGVRVNPDRNGRGNLRIGYIGSGVNILVMSADEDRAVVASCLPAPANGRRAVTEKPPAPERRKSYNGNARRDPPLQLPLASTRRRARASKWLISAFSISNTTSRTMPMARTMAASKRDIAALPNSACMNGA